jgi:hypothetical protein
MAKLAVPLFDCYFSKSLVDNKVEETAEQLFNCYFSKFLVGIRLEKGTAKQLFCVLFKPLIDNELVNRCLSAVHPDLTECLPDQTWKDI